MRREIATLVAEKCVDPATQRPYPVGVIDKAMTEAGFSVKQGKGAKAQVSECIKLLQAHAQLPIQRARMRVRVSVPAADAERVKAKVLESAEAVEKDEQLGDEWETVRVDNDSWLYAVGGTHLEGLTVCFARRSCLSTQANSASSMSSCRRNARAVVA